MDYPIAHPRLDGRGLTYVVGGIVGGGRLMVDGQEVKPEKRKYVVRANDGAPLEIQLKRRFFDPVPDAVVDGTKIELARPLRWYEYAWIGLPIFLATQGGALGALFGFAAVYASARVFRGDRGTAAKYALTGLISLAGVAAFVAAAVAIQLALARSP